jgi:hypothetical protein
MFHTDTTRHGTATRQRAKRTPQLTDPPADETTTNDHRPRSGTRAGDASRRAAGACLPLSCLAFREPRLPHHLTASHHHPLLLQRRRRRQATRWEPSGGEPHDRAPPATPPPLRPRPRAAASSSSILPFHTIAAYIAPRGGGTKRLPESRSRAATTGTRRRAHGPRRRRQVQARPEDRLRVLRRDLPR